MLPRVTWLPGSSCGSFRAPAFSGVLAVVLLVGSTPLSSQQAGLVPSAAKQAEISRYLGLFSSWGHDVTGGADLITWLNSPEARATFRVALVNESRGDASSHQEGTGTLTKHVRTVGDTIVYHLSVDSVARLVDGNWRLDAVSPPYLERHLWNRAGLPLVDSNGAVESAVPLDPRLKEFSRATLGILANFPPHLEERSSPSVWADTLDFGLVLASGAARSAVNGVELGAKENVMIGTWCLRADTLMATFEVKMIRGGMVIHGEVAILAELDAKRNLLGGVSVTRSRISWGLGDRLALLVGSGVLEEDPDTVTSSIGRLVPIRRP